jgi:hypothetical protein
LSGGGDKVDTADTVVKNFIAHCVKFNYTFEKLFDQKPAFDIPQTEFVDKLYELDFKTDH